MCGTSSWIRAQNDAAHWSFLLISMRRGREHLRHKLKQFTPVDVLPGSQKGSMPNYYVTGQAQANGEHEVHAQHCERLPTDLVYLGNFAGCEVAVVRARELYRQVNGCQVCSRNCHTE